MGLTTLVQDTHHAAGATFVTRAVQVDAEFACEFWLVGCSYGQGSGLGIEDFLLLELGVDPSPLEEVRQLVLPSSQWWREAGEECALIKAPKCWSRCTPGSAFSTDHRLPGRTDRCCNRR